MIKDPVAFLFDEDMQACIEQRIKEGGRFQKRIEGTVLPQGWSKLVGPRTHYYFRRGNTIWTIKQTKDGKWEGFERDDFEEGEK